MGTKKEERSIIIKTDCYVVINFLSGGNTQNNV